MISYQGLKEIALGFPDTTEEPHFEKTSFRIKKKIFATFDAKTNKACIKLSEADQSVYALIDVQVIYPVPNKWGKQGWTMVELNSISRDLLADALISAYCAVAPKKLAQAVRPVENG